MNTASLVLLALVAQTSPPTETPEARAKAQNLLKEGAKLYEKGAYAPALDKFEEAYAEYPSPKLLFNIGQASRDLGRLGDAMRAFEHFLAEATDAPAEMVAEAKKSVSELEGKLGKVRVQCSKPGAEIALDGKTVGVTPLSEPIWATPGKHQVTARHPDTAPAIEDVDVNASWEHTVVITLQPLAEVVAPVPVPAPAVPPKADVELRAREEPVPAPAQPAGVARHGRVWTWVAGGAAAVFAGAAVGLGVSMRSKFDSLNKSCGSESGSEPHCTQSDVDAVLLRRNLANVSWGLAAAAAVTTGVLFFIEGRPVAVAPMVGQGTGVLAAMAY
ncbi:MAG: PEGA domain-containing protein [Deltaproteobacteria bacterium]|nr:PEGA domain-containing protein [Deltaproteobacteria bacterium]